ncbi:MAG TPA: hypothetical protein VD763_10110 [Candidatus Saccharimonadales bacterium]|nr:hypothetical protein [Candidatus Saccharimonadales bacterium]
MADPPSRLDRLRAGAAAAAEPIVEGAHQALGAVASGLRELPGSRVRRVRRMGRVPLPSLAEVHPEARRARPVDIGMRTIDVDEIKGTAVGGGDQRGGDFLPLRGFRGRNWAARWQRLRRAQDQLVNLPAIDVVKYGDGYWVIDGHNRVALALYTGQRALDASVVELVPPGGRRTEELGSLAGVVEASRPLRSSATTAESTGKDASKP